MQKTALRSVRSRPEFIPAARTVLWGIIIVLVGVAINTLGDAQRDSGMAVFGAVVLLVGAIISLVGTYRVACNVDVAAEAVYVQLNESAAPDADETSW